MQKDNIEEIEKELEDLCRSFIDLFNILRNNGEINENDYYKHVRLKKEFIKKVNN